MSDKLVKSDAKHKKLPLIKWGGVALGIILLEAIAIGSTILIVNSNNKGQQAYLTDLSNQISNLSKNVAKLPDLANLISINSQRIADNEGNMKLFFENFNALKDEVGHKKIDILTQQFGNLSHKVEALEELKNNEALALSVALIIKENALYHRSFAHEAEILAVLTQNQSALTNDTQFILSVKDDDIPDNAALVSRFNKIIENIRFNNETDTSQNTNQNNSQSAMAKSIALIKDTVAGINFDKVVRIKNDNRTAAQVTLVNNLIQLVNSYDFSAAAEKIKTSYDFQKINNAELNKWLVDAERKTAFDQAISSIISSELNALRQDFSSSINTQSNGSSAEE